jgi:hypothetical protein
MIKYIQLDFYDNAIRMMMLGKRALRPVLMCGLLLLLWQGTAIFKKRKQQPQELLEDTQVLYIAPVAGDSHL